MNYVFAGKEIAAERLEKLHEVFFGSSEFFVKKIVKNKINVCIDLGCGAGHTTRSLASWTCSQECFGLDSSPYFIEQAEKLSKNYFRIKYKLHDVTKIPFPVKKADVIYARFLLTHLKDPIGCIKKWRTQLNPGGFLLLEETESIKTNVPVFKKYLSVVEQMLKSNENSLYVGKFLNDSGYEPELWKKYGGMYNLPVQVNSAATLFLLNVPSWRNHDFVREKLYRN